jgi:hypothetical protein
MLKIDKMTDKPTGKQVMRAGERLIRQDIYLPENLVELNCAFDILSYWRFCHAKPLENALEKIQPEIIKIDSTAIFAKRLKRFPSIVLKLRRFPRMNLKNMQDIGGCRIVVSNRKKLNQAVRVLKKMREFNYEDGYKLKDYIKNPKSDGYRSFHIIGLFNDDKGEKRKVEVQLRTRIQHYWATALEIIDLFTKQSLKTNQGEKLWSKFFIDVSQHFVIMDDIHLFNKMDQAERLKNYLPKLQENRDLASSMIDICESSRKLNVLEKLNAFANSLRIIGEKLDSVGVDGYVLLEIDIKRTSLTYRIFEESSSKEAQDVYTEAEKVATSNKKSKDQQTIVALVYAKAFGGIREAYPNFFADSSRFLEHLSILIDSERLMKKNFFQRILDKANLSSIEG